MLITLLIPLPITGPSGGRMRPRDDRIQKEQIIHGYVYRNIKELRDAVRGFVDRYNAQLLLEKNDFLSSNQSWEQWNATMSVRSAA